MCHLSKKRDKLKNLLYKPRKQQSSQQSHECAEEAALGAWSKFNFPAP
jgi:hypothetical protein